MTTTVLDNAGRIVIPKPMRDELGLGPGDVVSIELADAQVTIRPQRAGSAMRKERGVWVLDTSEPISEAETSGLLESVRRRRDDTVKGR